MPERETDTATAPTSEARPRRRRLRKVGEAVTTSGTPALPAWARCLTLSDLQKALLRSSTGLRQLESQGETEHEDSRRLPSL